MKEFIALTVIRLAALRAPSHQRAEFLAEWRAEILRELRREDRWSVVRSAFGAFADARARRTIDRAGRRTKPDGLLMTWMQSLDVSARSLTRTPGFTAIAVITLAIGLGSTAAIYTLVDRIVLDPLDYPNADRLVVVENQVPGVSADEIWALSTAQWVYYVEHAPDFEALGISRQTDGTVMTSTGPLRARTVYVTREVLPLLGAATEHGRLLAPDDDIAGAERVAVVSQSFWRDQLGADPGAIGSSITLNDEPIAVVGVLDEDVRLPWNRPTTAPQIWLALRVDLEATFHNSHGFQGLGLLEPGATPEAAERFLGELRGRLPERFPIAYSSGFFEQYGFRTRVEPLQKSVVGDLDATLWLLLGGVGLVLLIASANVANLFLVRIDKRRRELALRVALGADGGAIGRYVLSDALVLALGGAVLGLALASVAIPALVAMAPEGIPRIDRVTLGIDTAVFSLAVSIAVAAAISAWPVLTRESHVGQLRAGARGASLNRVQKNLRGGLIATQIALAMSLLVGAGLLIRSVSQLHAVDIGFSADGVAAIDVYASSVRYPDDVALWQLHRQIVERVEALPGVESAALGESVPVSGGYGCTVQGFEDATKYDWVRERGLTTCAGQTRVTPGYFETLGIPLREGRYLEAGDNDDPARGAVVVSQAFADRFWPGESALGQGLGPSGRTEGPFYHVVGVVGDVPKAADEGRPPLADPAIAVYYPGVYLERERRWGGWWPGTMTLLVQTQGDPSALFVDVRRVIEGIDPEIPLNDARVLTSVVDEATEDIGFLSTLLMIAAAAALILATVGLYGVVSWVVSARTREIGTRLAIGARPATVVRSVVLGTIRLALWGLAVGVPLAYATSRLGQTLIAGASPTTPATYIGAIALVTSVALLAAWLPARRAAAVDPATSLRHD